MDALKQIQELCAGDILWVESDRLICDPSSYISLIKRASAELNTGCRRYTMGVGDGQCAKSLISEYETKSQIEAVC